MFSGPPFQGLFVPLFSAYMRPPKVMLHVAEQYLAQEPQVRGSEELFPDDRY